MRCNTLFCASWFFPLKVILSSNFKLLKVEKHTTFNVLFVTRSSRSMKLQKENLFARITVEKQRVEMSLCRDTSVGLFNTKAQRCLGSSQESKQVNDFLRIVESNLNEIRKQLILEEKVITAELIRARYKGEPDPDEVRFPLLLELYNEHNQKFKELIGTKNHSESTYNRHLTSINHVAAFIKYKYKKDDLELEKVDYRFLSDYEHYFKAIRGCNHNSTMKYIKNLGKIIRIGIGEGYITLNPFNKFKLTYEQVEREILSQEEVERMIDLDIKIPRLDRVRDMFVFCIHTGISFCDVKVLKMSHFNEDKDGVLWVKNKRLKTGIEFLVPILPNAQKIIDKYANDPERIKNDLVVPKISNQNYNGYLKELADQCGITINLASHIARHTFATTITLANNVPIEAVSKMLGHRDIKTTQIYAKVAEKAIKNGMAHLLNPTPNSKTKKKSKKNKKGGKQND